ncbi:NAD(P)/FAD-dependent oxidoreductase [Paenibacillus sacheonensis]|uniref:Aminoacetone oxidase family FAD-binding enzyme n=1 Tax=Paenibacillus sacheonensis TaxID=742054 RepID=A0A7X5C0W0_9BACL|nr:NAD(P)/FAD-dependent oxidoreductase [Paenibacillus sacheonensis]MBM7567725.1 putative Rossmann fold flavoprotein [Paenibacillus sacheonensis]NBC72001.1 aminoacetone oxidase family FAD-binding enzyme [Paenibacillus sacheonensis]
MNYEVIIIGGGSAGLMAAIAASKNGASTLLLDKGDKLGRKLGISGGGRCNVTNNKELDELIKFIPGNGRFLYSALTSFGNKDIIAFFEGLGIALKEEDNGRMFPVSDKAKTVVDALIGQVRKQGVDIRINAPVKQVLYEDGRVQGVLLPSGERITCRSVIVATGGKSVPHTGSTGDGYPWAERAGHSITELFPTEVPITSNEPYIQSKELQGLSLRDVSLSVWNAKGKRVTEHRGDMIFTHFGVSGPIALRCSQFVVKELKKGDARNALLTIDLRPDQSAAEVYDETLKLAGHEAKKTIKNVLRSYLPERMLPVLLKESGLDEQLTYDHIPKQAWLAFAKLIKAFPMRAYGTLKLEDAFVTGGGVNLKEIDPKTMQSKLMRGLYFCGEVLDIHGYTGGYNITAAFSTGYSAGSHAALAD